MHRPGATRAIAMALGLTLSCAAWAGAPPSYRATRPAQPGTAHVYLFSVEKAQLASDWWRFTVKLASDPSYGEAGGAKSFAVYLEGLDPEISYDKRTNPSGIHQGWRDYAGANSAGWTDLGGGWQWNTYPGPDDTTASIGWMAGSTRGYLRPGETYTFDAINLPTVKALYCAAHIDPRNGTQTYWQREDPPSCSPEPTSLLLLGTGLLPVVIARRRRK